MDKVYAGENYYKEYHVKLPGSAFNKANELIDLQISRHLSQIDSDYYLYAFSDDELLEVIENADEWNNQDVLIARKILKDRGFTISDKEIAEKKWQRVKNLATPEKESPFLIGLGYFFAIFFGFFGLVFGLLLMNLTKTLPDGGKLYVYDQRTRNHGKNIVIIGAIITLFVLIWLTRNFDE